MDVQRNLRWVWAGLLGSCWAVAAVGWAAAPAAVAGSHPNVLLILTDDQGYGDLRLHGNPYLKTPHIDGLAQSGVRFERFYVNSFCSPTRAALLTGRYPLRCGVWGVTHNKETMRAAEVTIAEALQAGGYRTGCFGKWHNGEQYPLTPTGQGFQEFLGFHNGHINNYFDTELIRGTQPAPTRGYVTDVLTDAAIEFVRRAPRPFFCYLPYNAPHQPYQVPDRYFDRFQAMGLDPAVAAFFGMCENIDDNVGRLLAVLDELGIAKDTIVLFLTDNGGTAGVKLYNAGMRGGKTSVHEGGCRVPLFIRWTAAGWPPHVVPQLTSHIDIYSTLLDLCGVPRPAGPPLDGVNLRPLLEGRDASWPERILYTHNPITDDNRYPGAVRTERFRLVRDIKGPSGGSRAKGNDASATPWQLYDMQADPGETKDLAKKYPDEVQRLSGLYEKWIDDVRRPPLERFPIPVGYAQENPVELHSPQAYFSGSLNFFAGPGYAHDYLTGWTATESKIWFDVDVVRGGAYQVQLRYGCPAADAGSKIRLAAGDQQLEVTVPAAEAPVIRLPHRDEQGHQKYVNRQWGLLPLGTMTLPQGRTTLTLEALTRPATQVLDFKGLVLRRVDDAPR